jgi:hypothetical protein
MGEVSELLAKLNSSLAYRSKSALATSKTLVDNPSAIYKKAIQSALAPDIFEGIWGFEAVVLLTFAQDKEITFFSRLAQSLQDLPLSTSGGSSGNETSKIYYFCYIPRLHGHMINPFEILESGRLTEFITRVERLPFFLMSPTVETASPIGIGSVVTVSFSDPNRTVGIISSVQIVNDIDLSQETIKPREALEEGDALPPPPGGPAVYDEGFNPDEAVYPGSKYTWRMVTTTNTGLNNTPVDQSARNNLVNLTKNILEKLDAANISFNINSAYRSPEVNTAVKGAKDSYHMKGSGVDLHFTGADKSNRKRQVEMFEKDIPEAIGSWHKMIIYEDTNHIHISAGGSSGKKLVKTKSSGYENWDYYKGPLSSHKTNKGNA